MLGNSSVASNCSGGDGQQRQSYPQQHGQPYIKQEDAPYSQNYAEPGLSFSQQPLRPSVSMPVTHSAMPAEMSSHTHLLEFADIATKHGQLASLQPGMSNNEPGMMQQMQQQNSMRASTNSVSQPSKSARYSSESGPTTPPKSHTQRKYAKICTVCGDKALGYNFDAISCESCKAFFRRNAQKLTSLRCAYNDNCQIDKANRKLCRRCRLRKCFRVGMRIEYIQSEEQKQRKRDIVEQNRVQKTRDSINGSIQSPTSEYSEDDIFPNGPSPMQQSGSQKRRSMSMSSGYSGTNLSPTGTPGFTQQDRKLYYPESGGTPIDNNYCIVPASANELTVEDCHLIDEAVNAWKNSLCVKQGDSSTPTTVNNGVASQEDLLNVSEISFRRMVAMFKSIQHFRQLDLEDQKSLLRGGALDLLILRSVLIYNPETRMFLDPTDDPNFFGIHSNDLRKMADALIVDGLVSLIESFKLKLQVDDVMLIILLLVTLFSDDRADLNDRPAVARNQERYTTALQHYIQTMRATSRGACSVLFADLIVKLRELRSLSTTYETVVPFLKQWAIKPLMRELLKLMPPNETPTAGIQPQNSQNLNPPPGVDEDLIAAQCLFRQHGSMMASQNFAFDVGNNSIGSVSTDAQQQMSPSNPSSVISNFSLLTGDQSLDLPSIHVDLP